MLTVPVKIIARKWMIMRLTYSVRKASCLSSAIAYPPLAAPCHLPTPAISLSSFKFCLDSRSPARNVEGVFKVGGNPSMDYKVSISLATVLGSYAFPYSSRFYTGPHPFRLPFWVRNKVRMSHLHIWYICLIAHIQINQILLRELYTTRLEPNYKSIRILNIIA